MNRPSFTEGLGRVRDFINDELIPWIQSGRPLRSPTCEVHEGPDGTLILPGRVGVAGTVAADVVPFEVLDASTTSPDAAKVRIVSGLVNALDPVTDGPFSPVDDPVFTLEVADEDRIYLEITLSYASATGIWSYTSYDVIKSSTVKTDTATKAYQLLAQVAVDSNAVTAITPAASGNIGHERCGDSGDFDDYWWAGPTA